CLQLRQSFPRLLVIDLQPGELAGNRDPLLNGLAGLVDGGRLALGDVQILGEDDNQQQVQQRRELHVQTAAMLHPTASITVSSSLSPGVDSASSRFARAMVSRTCRRFSPSRSKPVSTMLLRNISRIAALRPAKVDQIASPKRPTMAATVTA